MNDPKFLRVETLFPAFQRAGCRIAVVTAKDKLRGLLGKGLELAPGKACSFSSEKSDKASLAENGIENVMRWSACRCRTSTVPACRSSCSPPASG